jgi:alanine-synthesizing transaminase
MFSDRVPSRLEPNRITEAVRRARADQRQLLDLTMTNPTIAGFAYPAEAIAALATADALRYDPQPFGRLEARRAVACDYARRGQAVDPDRVVLTASTSEAYSLLFKLLCAAHGDAVLVPVPSYPLFDHLTALDGVRSIPYRLDYHGRWTLSVEDVDHSWSPQVRAVLAVSPNNPTGSVLSAGEAQALAGRCAERQAALIVDEVFADYPLMDPAAGDIAVTNPGTDCLTFRFGGLSKSAGLPQLKLGWMAVEGPDALVAAAMERLEVICDAYLSVSTPVQLAAAQLIDAGASVRRQILGRVRGNYAALVAMAAGYPEIDVLPATAGWSAVLRVPSTRSEEELVVDLLDRDGVLVHPGFFFDFPHESFLVVSLLPEPDDFAAATRRILERARA